jgi:pimeloyl-ACP methyl ester carboxylesterase
MKTALLLALTACATGGVHARRVEIGGLPMYVEEAGSGRALLLLHGGGSTAQTTFGALIPALSRDHRVIAPEQQAHGHTPDIDRPLSFAQMADDTAALLERLDVREVDVIGFSSGGVVAMQLAIRHPALVRRLVLCSTFYSRAAFPPAFWSGFATATMSAMPQSLRSAFEAAQPDPAMRQRMFDKQVAMMHAFTDIPDSALRGIAAPALVMLGDRDVMSVEHNAALARLLPHGELAVLPGAVHGSYLGAIDVAAGDPTIARQLIERFLAE